MTFDSKRSVKAFKRGFITIWSRIEDIYLILFFFCNWQIIIQLPFAFVLIAIFISSMQFHWQFLIAKSGFWLVNILLQKFDSLPEREMKMMKKQVFWWRRSKNAKKVHLNLKKHFLLWTRPTDTWCNML